MNLFHKLNPTRFPGMSPLMATIVGYVLDESFTDPTIAELAVSEQENIVSMEGRRAEQLIHDAAGLTAEERKEAVRLFNVKVEKVPGTGLPAR